MRSLHYKGYCLEPPSDTDNDSIPDIKDNTPEEKFIASSAETDVHHKVNL